MSIEEKQEAGEEEDLAIQLDNNVGIAATNIANGEVDTSFDMNFENA